MTQNFLYDLISPHCLVSIIGMCKNAGKTTALNSIIQSMAAKNISPAFTSVGRDGEDVDIVTGTAKPSIYIYEGSLLATAAGLLDACDITKEILAATGLQTPLGEIVVLRALSGGYVQLAGPSTGGQLKKIMGEFLRFGADKIIVDGAISRKTFAAVGGAAILCTGASLAAGMDEVVKETLFVADIFSLPPCGDAALLELAGNLSATEKTVLCGKKYIRLPPDMSIEGSLREYSQNDTVLIYVGGALTDLMLESLFCSGVSLEGINIAVHDAGKILISRANYEKLRLKKSSLQVLHGINLLAITINPFSAYGHHFDKDRFKESFAGQTKIPVLNVEDMTAARAKLDP